MRRLLATAILMVCLLYCVAPASAEVSLSFELDAVEAKSDGVFSARLLLTGAGSLPAKSPTFYASDHFSAEVVSRDVGKAPLRGQSVDQVIFSLKFQPKPGLSVGTYELPPCVMELAGERKIVRWPSVQLVRVPVRQSSNLRLWQSVSTAHPFVGEQVIYSVVALVPGNASKIELNNVELEGIWTEDFPLAPAIDGGGDRKEFRKLKAIFPLQAGAPRIPARSIYFELVEQAPVRRRFSPDDEQFSGMSGLNSLNPRQLLDTLDAQPSVRRSLLRLSAEGLTLNVRSLPARGRDLPPQAYVPVGAFEMVMAVEDQASAEGVRAATVTLKGDGNLRPVQTLNFEGNESFSVFVSAGDTELTVNNDRLFFQKKFNVSLVPKRSGMLQVPEFSLLTFDPQAEAYRVVRTTREAIFGKRDSEGMSVGVTTLSLGEQPRNVHQILTPRLQIAAGTAICLISLPLVIFCLFRAQVLFRLFPRTSLRKRALVHARAAVNDLIQVTYDDLTRLLVRFAIEGAGKGRAALTTQEACALLELTYPNKDDHELIESVRALFRQWESQHYGGVQSKLDSSNAAELLALLERLGR